jgi:hypothetical protein
MPINKLGLIERNLLLLRRKWRKNCRRPLCYVWDAVLPWSTHCAILIQRVRLVVTWRYSSGLRTGLASDKNLAADFQRAFEVTCPPLMAIGCRVHQWTTQTAMGWIG